MEFIKVSLLFLATIALGNCLPSDLIRNNEHNLNLCKPFENTVTQIYEEHIEVKGKFLQYQTYNVVFPSGSPNLDLIHCIMVEDLNNDGTGGYPEITSGGLGFFNVQIQIKSQLSKGFKFNVNIFADKV